MNSPNRHENSDVRTQHSFPGWVCRSAYSTRLCPELSGKNPTCLILFDSFLEESVLFTHLPVQVCYTPYTNGFDSPWQLPTNSDDWCILEQARHNREPYKVMSKVVQGVVSFRRRSQGGADGGGGVQ